MSRGRRSSKPRQMLMAGVACFKVTVSRKQSQTPEPLPWVSSLGLACAHFRLVISQALRRHRKGLTPRPELPRQDARLHSGRRGPAGIKQESSIFKAEGWKLRTKTKQKADDIAENRDEKAEQITATFTCPWTHCCCPETPGNRAMENKVRSGNSPASESEHPVEFSPELKRKVATIHELKH